MKIETANRARWTLRISGVKQRCSVSRRCLVGVQIQLQCDLLLEGYRPGEIVRLFPASWEFVALPSEEQFFGRE